MWSIALEAEPLKSVPESSRPQCVKSGDRPTVEEPRSTISTTPETYSGVAVEAIDSVDSTRSVREPSRIPDRMPMISEVGIITISTQSIRRPVSPIRIAMIVETGCLNTVEVPQLPWTMPQKRGAGVSGALGSTQRPVGLPVSALVPVQPGTSPSHSP